MEWHLCIFFPLCSQLFLSVLKFVKFFRFHDWRFQKNLSVLAWVLGGAKKVSWVCLRVSGSVIRKWHEMSPKSSRSFRGFETVYTLYPPWLLPHWLTHLGSCISMFACDILLIDAVCFDLSSGHRTATCPVHLQCQETRLSDKVHKISQGSNSSASHISPKSRFDDAEQFEWLSTACTGGSIGTGAEPAGPHESKHMESWESAAIRPSFPKKIWLKDDNVGTDWDGMWAELLPVLKMKQDYE